MCLLNSATCCRVGRGEAPLFYLWQDWGLGLLCVKLGAHIYVNGFLPGEPPAPAAANSWRGHLLRLQALGASLGPKCITCLSMS